MLLVLSPVVLSYIFHTYGLRPDNTVNYGELLEVKRIEGVATNLDDNTIFRIRQLKGMWSLLIVDSGECYQYCQDKLYLMRQIRLAMHVDKDRVARVWLINDNVTPDPSIVEEYEGTQLVLAKDKDLLSEFPYTGNQQNHIYVIDPMGHLMMRYPENPDPKRMIDDLKRLLKLSDMEH
ncbi:MAG: hypothetical protein RQ714_04445 [Nitrosomonas sp.]|nr:hypothetical protein [Nitrosomonas sp.]